MKTLPPFVRKVTEYITSDGARHSDEKVAAEHQRELDTAKQIQELLSPSFSTMRKEAISREMLLQSDKLMDILRVYRKKLPKAKAAG